jgi:hypothetical protein
MKKIIFILAILISVFSCKKDSTNIKDNTNIKDSCPPPFYYYNNQKIYFSSYANRLTIGFTDSVDFSEAQTILSKYNDINPLTQPGLLMDKTVAIVDINGNKTCQEAESIITKLQQDPNISFAARMFNYTGGTVEGLTNNFVVSLFSLNDTIQLQSLAKLTNTKVVGPYPNLTNTYILSADKTSKGNALDMANFFYENGHFQWAEPNFIVEGAFFGL